MDEVPNGYGKISQFCNLEPGTLFKFIGGKQIFVKMLGDTYKAVGQHNLYYPGNREPIIYDMIIPFRDIEVINDDGPLKTN